MESKKFNEKMAELIDSVMDGDIESLRRNKGLIDEIAIHCRGSKLYQRAEQQTKDFTKDLTALDCYRHMIIKVAKAPTMIHAQGTTLMFMPIIADKLNDAHETIASV